MDGSNDLFAHLRSAQIRYKVDELRRVIPKVGSSGAGLVQFWGDGAIRKPVGDRKGYGPWEPYGRDPDRLCTVDIGRIVKITDPRT